MTKPVPSIRGNPTVVCVLRSGGEYKPSHVQDLCDGIRTHWPVSRMLRVVVLTDMSVAIQGAEDLSFRSLPLRYGWPGWWSKLELFRPELQALDSFLYFDLDTRIVGDLGDIAATQTLTMLQDFYRADRLGSGLMYLPGSERGKIWKHWIDDPYTHMRKFRGDQEFLTPLLQDRAELWQVLLPDQVVSYKVHVKPQGGVPWNARVVCFHGRPRPWQVKGFAA